MLRPSMYLVRLRVRVHFVLIGWIYCVRIWTWSVLGHLIAWPVIDLMEVQL
jgi:hypothetical protein